MKVNEIVFDCETYPIDLRPQDNPKAGCNPVPKMVCATFYDGRGKPQILRGKEACKRWIGHVRDHTTKLIGHNVSFDQHVMLRACWDEFGEDCLPDLVEKYDNPERVEGGTIHDTKIRQQLIDIATTGMYRRTGGYHLSDLVDYHLDRDISEWKGDDAWRLRYNELDPYPTATWPEDARRYAKFDTIWTWEVYQAQKERKRSAQGEILATKDFVVNEEFQVRADLALSIMGAWGLSVNQEKVASLKQRYIERRDELEEKLQSWGVVDENGKTNQSEKRRIYGAAFREAGIEPIRTEKTGKISTGKKSRNKLRRTGFESEKLRVIEEYDRICDYLSTYMEPLELVGEHSLCPNWNVLVESGRTSSSGPNMQNFPKRDHPNETIPASEVRKCFQPRPGNVFVCADWASAELRTLAQINVNMNNDPVRMASALQEGRDLHLDFAAQLEGVSYERAEELYEAGDEDIEQARDVAKVANFGFPGGLQPEGFVGYAYGFGVEVSESEARRLYDEWMRRWPEMDLFFQEIKNAGGPDPDSFPIKQDGPGGDERPWRTRRCNSWTSAANSKFQGMAGDGAKESLWRLMKACYVDESSPLYGFRLNAFVHDEFLIEGPKDRAVEAALELRRIMIDGMEIFTPDVPVDADVEIGEKWGGGDELNPEEYQ